MMHSTRFRPLILLTLAIQIALLAPTIPTYARPGAVQPQAVSGLNLKFPFAPGSEWQVTSGWEASNHQQAWNWYALDFVPVGRSCQGEAVFAADHGWIDRIDTDGSGAHRVFIRHANNYRSLYVHLASRSPLAEGAEVFHGTQIGVCGRSGNATGEHIHFHVYHGGLWDFQYQANGDIPTPIDGVTDQARLRSGSRGLYSSNGMPTIPANRNVLQNGDFSAGTNLWWRWGDVAWANYGGVLHFKREAGGTGGSVGQNMNYRVPPGSPFEIRLDLGNPSRVTKSPGVFLKSGSNWDIECHFSIPPNTPLRTYVIYGRTSSTTWDGFNLEVWPDPPDSIPDVQMDNVSVTYRPDLNISGTQCIAPVPAHQNLLQNSDFSAGMNGWWRWGDVAWANYGGVLHFKREVGGTGGSAGQDMRYRALPGTSFEIRLNLGNASSVTKSPGVFLKSGSNWDIECHFSIPPNTPLRTYVIRGRVGNNAWDGFTFEVWPDPPDSIPDVQMDNVSVTYRPDLSISSTQCISPTN